MPRPAPLVKVKALEDRISWDAFGEAIKRGETYFAEKTVYQGRRQTLQRLIIKGKPYLVGMDIEIGWTAENFIEI